jgi:tryptophan synthase alpha subunit
MGTEAREHDTTNDAHRDLGARGHVGSIGYAWCVREGAYHIGAMGATRIPSGRSKVYARVTVSRQSVALGVCDACGITRDAHADDHRYYVSRGAVAGTLRVATLKDSRNPRVRALA